MTDYTPPTGAQETTAQDAVRAAMVELAVRTLAEERNRYKAAAADLSVENGRLKVRAEKAERALRESDAEARLKERNGLRAHVSTLTKRVAGLSEDLDEAMANARKASADLAAAYRRIEQLGATMESMQPARDAAQRERDVALRAEQEALAQKAKLEEENAALKAEIKALKEAAVPKGAGARKPTAPEKAGAARCA